MRTRGWSLEAKLAYYTATGPGCHEWLGTLNTSGYGHLDFGGRKQLAHRIVWALERGPIPSGMNVLHHCDNPRCVKPEHLFVGTQGDNVADMMRKDRHARTVTMAGERHTGAKITEAQVREIRADKRLCRLIAPEHGISAGNVWLIKTRKAWAHVK
jgi:hypothetical protein